jgi:branched-chain amino acid transport system substrate-binding protein
MKKYDSLVMLLVAGTMNFLATTAQAQNIKIAVVGPTTGPVTQYGDMVREGVNTAVEQINAAGGIAGTKLELVTMDDGCEPKQGPVAANRVANEGIQFVVGGVCSGATIAAAPIYENEGIVMVTPSGTAPALTDGKNYTFIFRTIGRDDQQGPVAAQFIIEKIKPKKIAILNDNQSYGKGIASSVANALKKANEPIIYREGINAGESDYSAIITKLKSAKIDFVYYGGYHPEMGLLLRQAAEQGFKARFMGPEGAGNPELVAIAGNAVEGMLTTLPADFSSDPRNAALTKAFKEKNRNPNGAFQLASYAATQVIADAIQGVYTTGRIKGAAMTTPRQVTASQVATYLHTHTFNTPIGQLSWNKQGDLTNFSFKIYEWHQDGSRTLL